MYGINLTFQRISHSFFGKDYPKTLTTKEEKYQHETELTLI